MKLHLIRHAEPVDSAPSGKDIERELTEFGRQQAKSLALHLSKRIDNSEVWCSNAIRTKETLEILQSSVSFGECHFLADLYLCSKSTYLQYLWESNGSKDLIIIGHNFGISDLLEYFTDDEISMQTCEYICIDLGTLRREELSKGSGIIIDRYLPK